MTPEHEALTTQASAPVCCVKPDLSRLLRRSVVSDSLQPHGRPWNFLGQNTGVGSLSPSPGDLPNPGIELRSPTLQADSLPGGTQGKPEDTGVGSLSFYRGCS